MGNWAVTWRYKPNDKAEDSVIHVEFLHDVKKSHVDYVMRHLVSYGEYVEILNIENTKKHDQRIISQRDYFKLPCAKYEKKFDCEWLYEGADCSCCEFAVKE